MASFSNSVHHHCLARVSLTKTTCMQKRFDICSIIVIIGGYFHIVTSNFKYFLTKKMRMVMNVSCPQRNMTNKTTNDLGGIFSLCF